MRHRSGKLSFRFLEDIAIADVAFEAEGADLNELFKAAAMAVMKTMIVDLSQIEPKEVREVTMMANDVETLLFNFLQELIFYKDAERLLFGSFQVDVVKLDEGRYRLAAKLFGEKLDMKKHELLVDVKAVTMHMFEAVKKDGGWKARVVLDV